MGGHGSQDKTNIPSGAKVQPGEEICAGFPASSPGEPCFVGCDRLCGHLGQLEECLCSVAPPGLLHLQEQVPAGAGSSGEDSVPVMLLLRELTSYLAALEKKGGLSS